MVKLSIIVTTYNSEKSIQRCLDSILNQASFDDIEIIVVDDGSKDNTSELCKKYTDMYPFITFSTHENAGVSTSRNIGVEKSHGKWLMFIDSDDYLLPNSLNLVKKYYDNNNDVIVFKVEVDEFHNGSEDGIEGVVRNKDSLLKDLLTDGVYQKNNGYPLRTVWAKIFRRDFIVENQISSPKHVRRGQDAIFMFKVYEEASSIYLSKEKIYHYFLRNANSITNSYKPNYEKIIAAHRMAMDDIIPEKLWVYYERYRLEDIQMFLKFDLFFPTNKQTDEVKKKRLNTLIDQGKYKDMYLDVNNGDDINRLKFAKKIHLVHALAVAKRYKTLKLLYFLRNTFQK